MKYIIAFIDSLIYPEYVKLLTSKQRPNQISWFLSRLHVNNYFSFQSANVVSNDCKTDTLGCAFQEVNNGQIKAIPLEFQPKDHKLVPTHGSMTLLNLIVDTPRATEILPLDVGRMNSNQASAKGYAAACEYATQAGAKVLVIPMRELPDWKDGLHNAKRTLDFFGWYYRQANQCLEKFPGMIVASSGNDGSDITKNPVWPASMRWPNLFVVAGAQGENITSPSNFGIDVPFAIEAAHLYAFEAEWRLGLTTTAARKLAATLVRVHMRYPQLTLQQLKDYILATATTPNNHATKPGPKILNYEALNEMLREKFGPPACNPDSFTESFEQLKITLKKLAPYLTQSNPFIFIPIGIALGLYGEKALRHIQDWLNKYFSADQTACIIMAYQITLGSNLSWQTTIVKSITETVKREATAVVPNNSNGIKHIIPQTIFRVATNSMRAVSESIIPFSAATTTFVSGVCYGFWQSPSNGVKRCVAGVYTGAKLLLDTFPGSFLIPIAANQQQASQNYLTDIADRWKKYLAKNPQQNLPIDQQQTLFENWVDAGIQNSLQALHEKLIRENKIPTTLSLAKWVENGASGHEIMRPHFEDIQDTLNGSVQTTAQQPRFKQS